VFSRRWSGGKASVDCAAGVGSLEFGSLLDDVPTATTTAGMKLDDELAVDTEPQMIYVSATGHDSANGGSLSTAVRTLSRAAALVKPGATQVNVAAGEYPLSAAVTLNESRHSHTAWVGTGDVLVSGGTRLTGDDDWKYDAAVRTPGTRCLPNHQSD